MDNSIRGDVHMLNGGSPCGVHYDVGYRGEPGLLSALPCWRLPVVSWYASLLLTKESHNHVAGEVLQGFPGIILGAIVEPAHFGVVGITGLAQALEFVDDIFIGGRQWFLGFVQTVE